MHTTREKHACRPVWRKEVKHQRNNGPLIKPNSQDCIAFGLGQSQEEVNGTVCGLKGWGERLTWSLDWCIRDLKVQSAVPENYYWRFQSRQKWKLHSLSDSCAQITQARMQCFLFIHRASDYSFNSPWFESQSFAVRIKPWGWGLTGRKTITNGVIMTVKTTRTQDSLAFSAWADFFLMLSFLNWFWRLCQYQREAQALLNSYSRIQPRTEILLTTPGLFTICPQSDKFVSKVRCLQEAW